MALAAGMVGFLVGGLAGVALVELGWAALWRLRCWVLPPERVPPSDRWGVAEFFTLLVLRPAVGIACAWLGCWLALRAGRP